jgi:hypothetical protein
LGQKAKWELLSGGSWAHQKAGQQTKQVMLNESCLNTGLTGSTQSACLSGLHGASRGSGRCPQAKGLAAKGCGPAYDSENEKKLKGVVLQFSFFVAGRAIQRYL